MIATALVAVFMVAVYGLFGLFALLALVVNVTLMFGIQSAHGRDADAARHRRHHPDHRHGGRFQRRIFERIRDEARLGQSPVVAIDKGFSVALGTIMDANATAFFAAVALLLFGGSGPVRGFAITFIIGILTTAFTAFTLTRL